MMPAKSDFPNLVCATGDIMTMPGLPKVSVVAFEGREQILKKYRNVIYGKLEFEDLKNFRNNKIPKILKRQNLCLCDEKKNKRMHTKRFAKLRPESKFLEKDFTAARFAKFLCGNYIFGKKFERLFVYVDGLGRFVPFTADGSGGFDAFSRVVVNDEFVDELTKSFIAEVFLWVMSERFRIKLLPARDAENLIAFSNGTFDLATERLLKSSHKNLLTHGLDFEFQTFNKEEFKNTVFWGYINHLADNDDQVRELLRLVIGLAICNIRPKYVFFLVGPTNNGKTVFCNFLNEIIGESSVATISLAKLGERFSVAEIFGKQLVICPDEQIGVWSPAVIATLKNIVGRDSITVERKYEHPFAFRPDCLMVCASNALPQYSDEQDAGGAISRRIFAIPTGPTIPVANENPHLLEAILEEKEQIVAWALKRITKIYRGESFPDPPILCQPSRITNDAFADWCSERLRLSDAKVSAADLYEDFKTFADCYGCGVVMREKSFYMRLASSQYGKYKRKIGARSIYE